MLRTASVAKVLLLGGPRPRARGRQVAARRGAARDVTPPVADSGLWHLMAVDALPVEDVALLVGAVSDNWATNVLVERLGLDAVARLGARARPRCTTSCATTAARATRPR